MWIAKQTNLRRKKACGSGLQGKIRTFIIYDIAGFVVLHRNQFGEVESGVERADCLAISLDSSLPSAYDYPFPKMLPDWHSR